MLALYQCWYYYYKHYIKKIIKITCLSLSPTVARSFLLTIKTQHPQYKTAAANLQQYIHTLEDWLTSNRMKVSPNKSSLTLITPFNQEIATQPHVTLYNTPIPVNPNPTILGVTLDPMLTFRQHTDNINTKAKSRLNVLRALTHTKYGHSKKHITQVYKQFSRPTLAYAHTAWQPLLKDTNGKQRKN